RSSDLVNTAGGTGFTGRDITPESLEPLFDKRMDGFSIVFHRLSFDKIGTSTVQSRATAGLISQTFVFALPGSPGACRDAWDGILREQFDYRHKPCNFVEILPRLDEHLRRNTGYSIAEPCSCFVIILPATSTTTEQARSRGVCNRSKRLTILPLSAAVERRWRKLSCKTAACASRSIAGGVAV